MAEPGSGALPERLGEHLRSWVGAWPPERHLQVVANPRRALPGWDGSVAPVAGVVTAEGDAVIGVLPEIADDAAAAAAGGDLDALLAALPGLLGRRGIAGRGVFRWSTAPADLPDAGIWIPHDDPRVPEWLRPFGGDVLVVLDDDRYVAGVGIKKHDAAGNEISVGTEEAARGRGLARRLVAQAARRILADGAVPTYLHAADNVASAKAADAAGFPDLGWKVVGFFPLPG
ncbi:MAG TPA: GNAT family N-acetyltransferase [Kineosporiaceae bacterium]|nr:GNAT family N-acetyltransferase [Kineosporiaceae bacterium]